MWTLLQLTMVFVFVSHRVAFAQDDCGNTSFSGIDGVVSSPNFPLPYPHNINCTYSIDVGQNNSVLLKFLNFDLELPNIDGNCTSDWLMITCKEADTDEENLDFRKRYCGTTVPRTSLRFFNCPVVELKFFADSSVGGGGFSMEYNVIENSTSADSVTDLACGDTMFTSSSGLISLPSNPTDYSATVNCTYTVSTAHRSTFLLGVASLQLPDLLDSFEDCSRDNVMVGCVSDGETELNPSTSNTYCRRSFTDDSVQPSRFVFSDCSMVKISIRSSDYNYRGTTSIPFTVSAYDEDCGAASFTGPTGIITSPRFPLLHPHSLNCLYSINTDRTKTVSLYFLSFNIEESSSSSDQCSYDWITVSCLSTGSVPPGNPPRNKKYCGLNTKQMRLNYSNCDSLTLNFVTDSTVNTGGFAIQYTITSSGNETASTPDIGRGNASFTGVNGFITSPRFPLSYPNNAHYVYSIDVDRSKTVGLFFYSFNLEGSSHFSHMDSCNHDWLLISCSSSAVSRYYYHQNRKYCGSKTTPMILSYTNCESMTLNFVSDSSVTRGGFKIWYSISSTGQSSCKNTSFSGPNGVITSPNFPLQYPYNFGCIYSINADRNSSVQLKFKYFNMGVPNAEGYCTHDWVKITCNVTTKTNPYSNRKFCGAIQWTSSMRFVDCQNLKLQFSSGSSANRAGFMIEYTVVDGSNATDDNSELECGTTLFTDSTGVISLPRNPTNLLAKVNCTYTISTNQTSVIWLNTYFYSSMELLQSFQDCNRENLMIGCAPEGETELNTTTTRVFCRRGSSAPSIPWGPLAFEDCRTLKLSILSHTYDYRETFPIPFTAIGSNEICGNTSFSAPVGIISNLRLPFQYSKGARCLYSIDSGHVNPVALIIDRLYFGSESLDRSCRNGWLTITCVVNGTSMAHPLANRKLCGTVYPSTATFPACKSVLLNFSSNDLSFGKGLTIRYRIGDYELDCGTTLFTDSTGVINLPSNPTSNLASVNCTYTISTNQTSTILLNTHLYGSMPLFTSFQDCSKEYLKIGCVSEGQTELDPGTAIVLCRPDTLSYESPSLVFHDCQTLKLTVRSSAFDYRFIFPIPFSVLGQDEICGNTSFSALSGIIAPPRLPYQYRRSVSCLYTIDSGHVNSVVLGIDRLFLGSWYWSEACNSGWLTITCLVNETAMAHPLADKKLCRTYQPTVARFAACRRVLLNYSSESTTYSYHHRGFTIRYRMGDYDAECGNTSFSGSTGFITSPRFPLSYPHNLNCLYSIVGGDRKAITLSFDSFRLDGTSNTPSMDYCYRDWLTVSCLSDESVIGNLASIRRYCGIKTTPLTFEFLSCAAVLLNFRSDPHVTELGFKARYTVIDTDIICGVPAFGRPSGVIRFPWNYTDYNGILDCNYVINATEPSSISLTIWSTSFQSSNESSTYCQRDWLSIACMNSQRSMNHKVTHACNDSLDSSTQLTFTDCVAAQVVFHRDFAPTAKTFRIEYTVTSFGDLVPLKLSGHRGRDTGISLTVILLIIGAVCLAAFLFLRRQRKRNLPEMLLPNEERAEMELEEDDSTKAGSIFGGRWFLDRDTSRFLPLRPISIGTKPSSSSSSITRDIEEEEDIQAGL